MEWKLPVRKLQNFGVPPKIVNRMESAPCFDTDTCTDLTARSPPASLAYVHRPGN